MSESAGPLWPEGSEQAEDTVDLAEFIVGLSDEFDTIAAERHRMGAEKYGPGKFLTVDTIEECLFEVVDLANYARYTFIKLRLLQESLRAMQAPEQTSTNFITSRDLTKPQE